MTVEAGAATAREAGNARRGPAGWDLSMHILDLAQNSVKAGAARIEVRVDEDPESDALRVAVTDNGRGMDASTAARLMAPLVTARRGRVAGHGLPLLHQAAAAAGGSLRVTSAPGAGTRVEAVFGLGHVDRAPLGDLEATVLVLFAAHPGVDFAWAHRRGPREYGLSSADLRAALDGASLASPAGIALARSAVRHGEASLSGPADARSRTEDPS